MQISEAFGTGDCNNGSDYQQCGAQLLFNVAVVSAVRNQSSLHFYIEEEIKLHFLPVGQPWLSHVTQSQASNILASQALIISSRT